MANADAEYAIEIAAQMTGGDQTIAQLDALTADLRSAGKSAEHFQEAIAKVSRDLDVAAEASRAANEALALGNAQYRELERAADKAAKAAERAAKRNGGIAPGDDVIQRAYEAKEALDAYSVKLRDLEGNAKRASDTQTKLGATLGNLKRLSGHVDKSLGAAAEQTEKVRGALAAVPGAAGQVGSSLLAPIQGFQKLAAQMGAARAVALLASVAVAGLAAAAVALTAAAVAGAAAVASWAVSLADAKRSAGLAQEAAEALHPELAGLRDTMAALKHDTNLSGDTLNKLAADLIDAKVSASDLPAALRAAALAEKALGAGGASDFIADIKKGKTAVSELARTTQQKFGGIVARQMLGLDEQSKRLSANFTGLFSGLNIDPVLTGMQRLADLFDENTSSGKAIKFLFESVFQPLIDQADNASIAVEAFALGFEIGLVKLYIAIKPAINAIAEFFGFDDPSLSDLLATVTKAGEYAAYVFAGFVVAIGAMTAAVGLVIAAMVAFEAVLIGIPIALYEIAKTIFGAFNDAFEWLTGIDLAEVGSNMIAGLARGILNAAPRVLEAMSGAVHAAIDHAKALLGIASPSKVFAEIGEYTGEGFAQGIDDTADQAQRAMAEMVAPPDVDAIASPLARQDAFTPANESAPAQSGAAPAAGGRSGPSVTFAGPVNFYGVKDAEHGADLIAEAVTRVLEGDAAQLGSEVAA